MNVPLDEVLYFDVVTSHPSTGAAADADSTPTFAVFEEATDTDIGVGGNLTKRTSLTGNYRGSFTLSTANGFEVGKWYSVIVSATVNAIAGKGVVKNFRCVAAEATAGYSPLADGGITAAKLASDAITAAKVAADVTTEIQTGLATAASIAALNNLSAAAAADAVWDEARSGHTTSGTFGETGNELSSIKQSVPAFADLNAVVTGTSGTNSNANIANVTVDSRGMDYGWLAISNATSGTFGEIIDFNGNVWLPYQNLINSSIGLRVYHCEKPVTSEDHEIEVIYSGGGLPSIHVLFTKGCRLSDPIDNFSQLITGTGTSVAIPSITPDEPLCLVVSFLSAYAGNVTLPATYLGVKTDTDVQRVGGGVAWKAQTTATAAAVTWTTSITGDHAGITIVLHPETQASHVEIDNYQDGTIRNRIWNAGLQKYQRRFAMSGTYVGEKPATIRMRLLDSLNSDAVYETWRDIEGLACANGVWTGSLMIDAKTLFKREAKSFDGLGRLLGTSIVARNVFGVGIVDLDIGQSNGQRKDVVYDAPEVANPLGRQLYQERYLPLSGDGMISYVNRLVAKAECPVLYMNYSVPGSGLLLEGNAGIWNITEDGEPEDEDGPAVAAQRGIEVVEGDIELATFTQGECDGLFAEFDAAEDRAAVGRLHRWVESKATTPGIGLKFGVVIPGYLASAYSDEVMSALRSSRQSYGDEEEGAYVQASLMGLPLIDSDTHLTGSGYVSLGRCLAQSALHQLGYVDRPGDGVKILNAWRRPASNIVWVPLTLLRDSTIDFTGTPTGLELSINDFGALLTITGTTIVGRKLRIVLSTTPGDGATLQLRYADTKAPNVSNPIRTSFKPQDDSRGLPLLPCPAITVRLRSEYEPGALVAQAELPLTRSGLGIGYMITDMDGNVMADRTEIGVSVLGEDLTNGQYAAHTNSITEGFVDGFAVWDNGEITKAFRLTDPRIGVVDDKLNENFVQFVSENPNDKTIQSLTTPKNITITQGSG